MSQQQLSNNISVNCNDEQYCPPHNGSELLGNSEHKVVFSVLPSVNYIRMNHYHKLTDITLP